VSSPGRFPTPFLRNQRGLYCEPRRPDCAPAGCYSLGATTGHHVPAADTTTLIAFRQYRKYDLERMFSLGAE